MYDQRKYAVFAVSELATIDFNEVLETSADTVRRSVDGTKTFVKWQSESMPTSVQSLTTMEGPYTHEEILAILNTAEWSAPMQE